MAGLARRDAASTRAAKPSPSLVPAALALPGLALVLASGLWLMAAGVGYDLLFPTPADLTLSEAAVLGDQRRIDRLVRAGHDPNQPAPVRAGLLDDRSHLLTPVDAARLAGHPEVVEFLEAKKKNVAHRPRHAPSRP